jgi:hypothetical protein
VPIQHAKFVTPKDAFMCCHPFRPFQNIAPYVQGPTVFHVVLPRRLIYIVFLVDVVGL